jgi:hypothetical protein
MIFGVPVEVHIDNENVDHWAVLPYGIDSPAWLEEWELHLAGLGLVPMPYDECAWEATDSGWRVFCVELAEGLLAA